MCQLILPRDGSVQVPGYFLWCLCWPERQQHGGGRAGPRHAGISCPQRGGEQGKPLFGI